LQRSTNDRHLRVEFSGNILLKAPSQPVAAVPAGYRAAMQEENCTFEKVEVLPGNVGYMKLNSFPDPGICAATAQSAMARLRDSDAIIFDLRDNTGGFPEMVAKMAAPLFDHPVRWYNPREGDGSHWLSPSPGIELANKPVYILTSAITLSGAEQFTYNLKMLGRATVVGDTTGGGAHVGVFHRIDDHFGIGIPETRIINPYGKPDWEGTGVEPDVRAVPANALAVAEKLARNRLEK
jgi:C-terminal processing protease CtpA/Prc